MFSTELGLQMLGINGISIVRLEKQPKRPLRRGGIPQGASVSRRRQVSKTQVRNSTDDVGIELQRNSKLGCAW